MIDFLDTLEDYGINGLALKSKIIFYHAKNDEDDAYISMLWEPVIAPPTWRKLDGKTYAQSLEILIREYFNKDSECIWFGIEEVDCAVWSYPSVKTIEKNTRLGWRNVLDSVQKAESVESTAKIVGYYSPSKQALIYLESRAGLKMVFIGSEEAISEFGKCFNLTNMGTCATTQ